MEATSAPLSVYDILCNQSNDGNYTNTRTHAEDSIYSTGDGALENLSTLEHELRMSTCKEGMRQPCEIWYGLSLSMPVFVVTIIIIIIIIIIITDLFPSFCSGVGLRSAFNEQDM
jgi:hypothetical protein